MKRMHMFYLAASLALAAVTATDVAAAQAKPALIQIHSVDVSLPASEVGFPVEAGSELAGRCLICHSAGMVLKQPLMSEAQWKSEIIKMRNAYGAPVADPEIDALANYLSRVNAAQQIP